MSPALGGLLNSLTLVATAFGGFAFGLLADRIGRTRSLMATILIYSAASGACGLSQTVLQLGIFRFILGLGMGGEWTTGAALIAETWRAEHRGKALGLMQSFFAIGEMIAAGVVGFMLPRFEWRTVFFVGILPALLIFWIQRHVPEPEIWKAKVRAGASSVGRGLSLVKTTGWLIVMGVGKFLGFTSFGFAADTFGRRKSYVTYLLVATAL